MHSLSKGIKDILKEPISLVQECHFFGSLFTWDHNVLAVLKGCAGGSWIFSTLFQGQSILIIILRHYLLFCCADIYIDSAKALVRKTVGSLVQIKAGA